MMRVAPDQWTECDGAQIPVSAETVVDVKFRDNMVWRSVEAGWFDEGESNWRHVGTHHDITHFQVSA